MIKDIKMLAPKFVEGVGGASIDTGKKIVNYGKSNKFPTELIQVINKSVTGKACFDTYSDALHGKGLVVDGAETEFSKKFLTEILKPQTVRNQMRDFALLNWCPMYLRFNRFGKIASIDHIDITTARVGGIRDFGDAITKVVTNPDWAIFKNTRSKVYDLFDKEEAVLEMSMFGEIEPKIYLVKDYNPGEPYYPSPTFESALMWMYCEGQIAIFHSNNIDTGFFPTVIMTFAEPMTEIDEATGKPIREVISEKIRDKVQGVDKSNIITLFPSVSGATPPVITTYNPNDNDKLFLNLESICTNAIARGFKMPLVLANIETAGKLGSKEELIEKWEFWDNAVIKPNQAIYVNAVNEIAQHCQDWDGEKFKIESSMPISIKTKIEETTI